MEKRMRDGEYIAVQRGAGLVVGSIRLIRFNCKDVKPIEVRTVIKREIKGINRIHFKYLSRPQPYNSGPANTFTHIALPTLFLFATRERKFYDREIYLVPSENCAYEM